MKRTSLVVGGPFEIGLGSSGSSGRLRTHRERGMLYHTIYMKG